MCEVVSDKLKKMDFNNCSINARSKDKKSIIEWFCKDDDQKERRRILVAEKSILLQKMKLKVNVVHYDAPMFYLDRYVLFHFTLFFIFHY